MFTIIKDMENHKREEHDNPRDFQCNFRIFSEKSNKMFKKAYNMKSPVIVPSPLAAAVREAKRLHGRN